MLTGFLSFLYALSALLLILLVLVQKGKGSMGLGNLGGGTQMLFGGSGGQDLFQKATWVLGALLLFGSIGLSMLTVKYATQRPYLSGYQAPISPVEQD